MLEVRSPAAPSQDQELIQLRRDEDAMSQIMWELVRHTNPETHTAEVPAAVSDPLWALVFERGSKEGQVKILAGTNLPITESQKKRVCRFLRGTSRPMEDALRELRFEFPLSYVEQQIAAHLRWERTSADGVAAGAPVGQWISVKPPGFGERAMNAFGIPKA